MPALTGLRGLCALWVLIYHAWVYVTPAPIEWELFGSTWRLHLPISMGWVGVQMLFVLSAFLLTIPYARAAAGLGPTPRPGAYLKRRFLRVFPAFWLQLVVLIGILWVAMAAFPLPLERVPQYLLMMFMPPPLGVGSPANINGVWWTLPIELSFYLVLPLLAWLIDWRRRWLLLGLSIVVMLLWRYYVIVILDPGQKHVWTAQLPGSMDSFGLGMLGALIHVEFTQVRQDRASYERVLSALLLALPILFYGLATWIGTDFAVYWSPSPIFFSWTGLFSLGVMIFVLNCAINQRFCQLLASAPVFYLGLVSYGLYLWHAPLGKWLLTVPLITEMEGYAFPRLLLLMFAGALGLATASWFAIEKRAIALSRRRDAPARS